MTADQEVDDRVRLSENEARRVGSGVRTLQKALRDVFRLIDPPPTDSRFPLVDYDLSEDEVAAVRTLSEELSDKIDELSRLLDLEPNRLSARRAIDAAASYAWTVALEVHPGRFRQLGTPDPRLLPLLGSRFDALAEGFLALARLVEERTAGSVETKATIVRRSGKARRG